MSRNETRTPATRLSEGAEMIAEMRAGVVEALEEHKRLGQSIVTYDPDSGEVREIPPDQILPGTDQPTSTNSTP